MSPQTIKFLTFLQPNYITSIVEIIFLILIYKKLKEINNKRWTYGKYTEATRIGTHLILNLGLEFIKLYLLGRILGILKKFDK